MTITRRLVGAAVFAIATVAVAVITIASTVTASKPAVFATNDVALRGTDPVAYFTAGMPVAGKKEFAFEWNGTTWHFSSQENRETFAADPSAYAPQYGGYCAWAVSNGYTASTVPEAWEIVDGKLYLNYSLGVRDTWREDIPGNITRADENWPAVLE